MNKIEENQNSNNPNYKNLLSFFQLHANQNKQKDNHQIRFISNNSLINKYQTQIKNDSILDSARIL